MTYKRNTSTEVYEPEISQLNFPVLLSVADLQKLANQKLKSVLMDDVVVMSNKKDSLDLKVTRTGDLLFSLKNEQIHATIPLKVEVRIIKKMGESSLTLLKNKPLVFEIKANLVSPLTLLENIELQFSTKVESIVWKKEPELKILGIPFNLKEQVDKKLSEKIPSITKQIDKELQQKVNIRKVIDKIWKKIQYNKPLKKGEKDFVAKVQPQTLAVFFDKSKEDSIKLNLEVASKIYVRHEKDSASIQKVALPHTITLLQQPSPEKSAVYIHGLFPLQELNQLITKSINGKELENSGIKVKIVSLKLQNAKNNIVGEMKVSGDVNGKLKVMGFPVFLKETSTISIKNIKVETDVKDPVINSIADMFVNHLLSVLNQTISVKSSDLTNNTSAFARDKIQHSRAAQKIDVTLHDLQIESMKIKLGKDNIQLLVKAFTDFEIAVKKEALKIKKPTTK